MWCVINVTVRNAYVERTLLTTIVCNKEEMACDLQMTVAGIMKVKAKTKIYKIKAHEMHFPVDFLIGFCGSATEIIDVVDFYERPDIYQHMPKTRNLSGLILTADHVIYQFDHPGKWLAVDAPYSSVGSGALTAMGAMSMGATPKEAILAASKIDPFTGMGTKVFKI